MTAFTGLKLVAAKRPQAAAPIVLRRKKLGLQLWEQIELARASAEGRTFVPMRMRTVRDATTGQKHSVEQAKRVRQWWFTADTGRVCLQVRYGSRVLDLGKNKNSIEVGSIAELVNVLQVVKTAVDAGELDAQIEAASAAVRERFAK